MVKKKRLHRLCSIVLILMLVFSCTQSAFAISYDKQVLSSLEDAAPQYAGVVELGTSIDKVNLPQTVRGLVDLDDVDMTTFKQAEPKADTSDGYTSYDYYWYGYVAPKNVAQLYKDNKLAVYTIYCADPNSNSEVVTHTEYRVYGSLAGSDPMWFECTAEGKITAVVVDAAVKWDTDKLDLSKEGTYKLKGTCEEYLCSEPLEASILVTSNTTDSHDDDCDDCVTGESTQTSDTKDVDSSATIEEVSGDVKLLKECHCGIDGNALPDDNYPWAHNVDCKYYSPIECMCREEVEVEYEQIDESTGEVIIIKDKVLGGFSGKHDIYNTSCPLYGLDTVEVVKVDNGDTAIISQENAESIIDETVSYEALGEIDIVKGTEQKGFSYDNEVELLAVSASDGANSKAMVNHIIASTPTNGIPDEDGTNDGFYLPDEEYDVWVPIAWKEYINTIWMNKAMTSFDWTKNSGVTWKWSGSIASEVATSSKTAANTANVIPKKEKIGDNSVYIVYSGEQLQYALQELSASTANDKRDSMSQTVYIARDIDLNGMNKNWRPYKFVDTRIEISGYDVDAGKKTERKIYNLGSFSTDDAKGVGIAQSLSGNLVSEHMYYVTAMLTYKDIPGLTGAKNVCSLFGYSSKTYDACRLEDTHIIDSMFYGSEQVSAFGRREYQSNMIRCSAEDSYFYGGSHVTSLTTGITPYRTYKSNSKCTITVVDKGLSTEAVTVSLEGKKPRTYTPKNSQYILSKDNNTFEVKESSYGSIRQCYSAGNLLATYGGHSAGFASCYLRETVIEDCFSDMEMYVTTYSGAFTGLFTGTVERCFTTGKLEGFQFLGGFCCSVANSSINGTATFKNCYTTVLVGMRSESSHMGGFAATDTVSQNDEKWKTKVQHMNFENCYAAGEVGNISTDMSEPQNVGGFLNAYSPNYDTLNGNLYYDKQTTAMREWQTGKNQDLEQIKGVLTSNTEKSGSGLTNTSPKSGDTGFAGFGNSAWDYSEVGHYPELVTFKNASNTAFGTSRESNIAKAYSLASTSTVILDAWDTGYDWDTTGVRTENEISYNRNAADHKGGVNTYDTVRDIISPFKITNDATCTNMVNGGEGANITITDNSETIKGGTSTTTSEKGAIVIDNATKTGIAENPGMDWFRIQQKVGNETASRPIRLVGYMSIEAGDNKTITSGDFYNHRPDVRLTMMDTIVDNMVVGFEEHEARNWSTSIKNGYPRATDTTYSNKYYAVPTDRLVTNTNKATAEDAWIYTEIWKANQNSDGTFVEATGDQKGYYDSALEKNLAAKISVKVTGEGTGNNTTKAEQKWNGDYPFNLESSAAQKYIVSYYWMLTDGRYVTDYKIVTVEPGEYDLDVEVRTYVTGSETDPSNTESLKLGVAPDVNGETAYELSDTTISSAALEESVLAGTNVSAGVLAGTDNVKVRKTEIKLFGMDATSGEPVEVTNGWGIYEGNLLADLKALKEKGEVAKIPIKVEGIDYVYDSLVEETHATTNTKYDREITNTVENQAITYYAELADDGTINFSFKKFRDAEGGGQQDAYKDETGLDGVANSVYINDMMFDTKITLWVERDFEFVKTNEKEEAFGENDAAFMLYELTCDKTGVIEGILHEHSDVTGECWTSMGEAKTDANGHVEYKYLPDGEYRLVETSTKDGYALPYGQWKVVIDKDGIKVATLDANKAPAFTVDVDNNTTDENYLSVKNYPTTKITKVLAGNFADYHRAFDFKVDIANDGKTISLPVDVVGEDTVNYHEFTLGHEEYIEIPYYIPTGAAIEVTEVDLDDYDMTVDYNGTKYDPVSNGIIVNATDDADHIIVTNTRVIDPDTGIGLDTLPYVLILMAVAAVAGNYLYRRKTQRNN